MRESISQESENTVAAFRDANLTGFGNQGFSEDLRREATQHLDLDNVLKTEELNSAFPVIVNKHELPYPTTT